MGKDYLYQLIINWINLQQMAIVLQFFYTTCCRIFNWNQIDSNPDLCTVAEQTQWPLQTRSSSSMENATSTAHGLEGHNDFKVLCSKDGTVS